MVDLTMVDNCVTEAEIALLLSVTENRSVWPTLDIWQRHEIWFGEWNARTERWFQSHIRQIDTGSHFSLLSRKQWKSSIRCHTMGAFTNFRTVGTEAHVKWVCDQLDDLFPLTDCMTLT